jgi:hypothetical protein
MSVFCYVSNTSASEANNNHKVKIKIESAYNAQASLTKSVELSPDDYKAMQESPQDWAPQYFGIPNTFVHSVGIDNDTLRLVTADDVNAHFKYFNKWYEIAKDQNFLRVWEADASNAYFKLQYMRSSAWVDDMHLFINVPFVHACIREYIKEHQDIFGSIPTLQRMNENNARVQASRDVAEQVKELWNMCADQVCIYQHDKVREILSGVIKFSPSATDDDIWLCSYVCEREAGKKMIESWMKQLTPQQVNDIGQFASNIKHKECSEAFGNLLENVIEDIRASLPKPPSFLNATIMKRLGVAAGICGICAAIGYAWYQYGTHNDAYPHEKYEQANS